MNCSECEDLLAARVEDLLDAPVKPTLEAHLATCPACRTALDETCRLIDHLNDDVRRAAVPLITTAVMDRIVQQ